MKKLLKYLLVLIGLVVGAGIIMCGVLVIFPSVSIFNIKYQTRSKSFYNNINVEEFNFSYANDKGEIVKNNFSYSIPKFNTITINTDYYDVQVKASDVENNQNEIRIRMNKEYSGFIKANSKTYTMSIFKVLYDVENYVVYEVPKSDGSIEEKTIKVYKMETTFLKKEGMDYILLDNVNVLESNIRQGEEGIFKEEDGVKKIKIYEEDSENFNFYNIKDSYLTETYNLVIDLDNVEKVLLLKENTNVIVELPSAFFSGGDTNIVVNSNNGKIDLGGNEEVIQVVDEQKNKLYSLFNKINEYTSKYTKENEDKDNWEEQTIIYSDSLREMVFESVNLDAIDFTSKKFVNSIKKDNIFNVVYETLFKDTTSEYYYNLNFNTINVKTTKGNVNINKTIKFNDSLDNKLSIKTDTGSILNNAILNVSSSYESDKGNINLQPYHQDYQIINGNVNIKSNTSVVTMPSVHGNVVCDSKSGQITIDQLTGSFQATEKTSHTEININYVDGEFLVPEAEYSNITLKETNSKLSIYTKKGNVNIGNLTTITSAEAYKANIKTDSGDINVDFIDNTNLYVYSKSGNINLSYSKNNNGVIKYNSNNTCQLNIESEKSEINLNDVNVFLDVLVTEKTSKKVNVAFKEVMATKDNPSAIKVKDQKVNVKLDPTQPVTIVSDKANLDKLGLEEKNKTSVEYKIKKINENNEEVEVSYGKMSLFNQSFDEKRPTYSSNILILYSSSGDYGEIVVETTQE